MTNTTTPPIWKNVMRKRSEEGSAYGVLASAYRGDNPYTYFKITLPNLSIGHYRMLGIEATMLYDYRSAFFAKLFIRFYWPPNVLPDNSSESQCVSFLSNDPDVNSKIIVHGESPNILYVKTPGSYTTLMINSIGAMDHSRYVDIKDITIEGIESIPSTEITTFRSKALIIT